MRFLKQKSFLKLGKPKLIRTEGSSAQMGGWLGARGGNYAKETGSSISLRVIESFSLSVPSQDI